MIFFRNLFFLRFLCSALVAPVIIAPAFADDAPVSAQNADDVVSATTEELQAAASVMNNPEDTKIVKIESLLLRLGWDESSQEHRKAAFAKINELKEALIQNTHDLEDNYQNMQDKEKSFENRMLGAVGIGTVGIGGMMAAQSFAEQNADTDAEADMRAYLETFQCRVDGQSPYSGGTQNIELGGANQLIDLYQSYATLAADLQERKNALGLKPGIESEIVIDKATSGLYDDVGTGIGSGAYASIARALQNPDGEDAAKWNEMKEKTSQNLKTGATVAVAGAVASAAANYAINHNNKNKSDELLAQRDEIMEDVDNIIQFELDECNAQIQEKKAWAAEQKKTREYTSSQALQDEVAEIEALNFLTSTDDIYELEEHPVCN